MGRAYPDALAKVSDQMADLVSKLTLANLAARGCLQISSDHSAFEPDDLEFLVAQIESALVHARNLVTRIEVMAACAGNCGAPAPRPHSDARASSHATDVPHGQGCDPAR